VARIPRARPRHDDQRAGGLPAAGRAQRQARAAPRAPGRRDADVRLPRDLVRQLQHARSHRRGIFARSRGTPPRDRARLRPAPGDRHHLQRRRAAREWRGARVAWRATTPLHPPMSSTTTSRAPRRSSIFTATWTATATAGGTRPKASRSRSASHRPRSRASAPGTSCGRRRSVRWGCASRCRRCNQSDLTKMLMTGKHQLAMNAWNMDYPDGEDFFVLLYGKAAGNGEPVFLRAPRVRQALREGAAPHRFTRAQSHLPGHGQAHLRLHADGDEPVSGAHRAHARVG